MTTPDRSRREALILAGPGCALTLILVCYRAVLFEGGQFAYRDACLFYYPLYQRVQQEWAAGRWPLWIPGKTAGCRSWATPWRRSSTPGKLI